MHALAGRCSTAAATGAPGGDKVFALDPQETLAPLSLLARSPSPFGRPPENAIAMADLVAAANDLLAA